MDSLNQLIGKRRFSVRRNKLTVSIPISTGGETHSLETAAQHQEIDAPRAGRPPVVPQAGPGVGGSKFVEHMDNEVPAYGKSARILRSLEELTGFVQTKGPNMQYSNDWLVHDPAYSDPLECQAPKYSATTNYGPRVNHAQEGRPQAVPEKRPIIKLGNAPRSPARQTFSKLRDTLDPMPWLERMERTVTARRGGPIDLPPTTPSRASSPRFGRRGSTSSVSSIKSTLRSSLDLFRRDPLDDFGNGKYDKGAWKRK